MDYPVLHIRMLGGCSLTWDGKELSDADNRMRKVWLLLAYLIYRRTLVSPEEIVALLWEGEAPENPAGALKTMLYRVRGLLGKLGEEAGQTLILRREGGYLWNPEVPVELDVARVDELQRRVGAAGNDGERLELQRELLTLYGGDFLPKLSSETWVMPISAYYHRIYLDTVLEVLPRLEDGERWEESGELCATALKIEPYSEELYCHLIRSQLARGDQRSAISSYETMSDLLFSQFGVMPSDGARALYRLATRSGETGATHISSAKEMLKEAEASSGALFCEYDFFRILYQAQARAIVRSGDSIHVALITVKGRRGAELPRRSMDCAVGNLKDIIVENLRQGDVVTQCGLSQFLIMLPQANYENSCMVCDRLVRAFWRKYPHSPADIQFSVQPMEPAEGKSR